LKSTATTIDIGFLGINENTQSLFVTFAIIFGEEYWRTEAFLEYKHTKIKLETKFLNQI